MTDQELQVAIDSAREFLKNIGNAGGPLYEARQNTRIVLRDLEAIQVNRASMATQPTLMQMEE
jgi:hypothetical protein